MPTPSSPEIVHLWACPILKANFAKTSATPRKPTRPASRRRDGATARREAATQKLAPVQPVCELPATVGLQTAANQLTVPAKEGSNCTAMDWLRRGRQVCSKSVQEHEHGSLDLERTWKLHVSLPLLALRAVATGKPSSADPRMERPHTHQTQLQSTCLSSALSALVMGTSGWGTRCARQPFNTLQKQHRTAARVQCKPKLDFQKKSPIIEVRSRGPAHCGKVSFSRTETARREALTATGACIIQLKLRTESGAVITHNTKFQLCNVKDTHVVEDDVLLGGVQPNLTQGRKLSGVPAKTSAGRSGRRRVSTKCRDPCQKCAHNTGGAIGWLTDPAAVGARRVCSATRGRSLLCVRGEGVQGVLTLFCGGVAQTCHDDRVVELKEQLGVEEVDGEGQEGKVKEEGRDRVKENAPWMTWR